MRRPAAPNRPCFISSSIVDLAVVTSGAIITPLPSARPSALITTGNTRCSQYCSAWLLLENVLASAVGIFAARINSLAKIFDDSRRAADLVGPKMRNFSDTKRSTTPRANGSSGPTTVRSTLFCFANRTKAGRSVAGIATLSANCAVPALPGAQNIRSTFADCLSFQASACSRPPLPVTRIFIVTIHFRGSRVGCENFYNCRRHVHQSDEIVPWRACRYSLPRWRFRRRDWQRHLLGMADDRDLRVNADVFPDEHFVQVVDAANWLIVERHDHIAFTQTGLRCRTLVLN